MVPEWSKNGGDLDYKLHWHIPSLFAHVRSLIDKEAFDKIIIAR
jgi:hypothetical protein